MSTLPIPESRIEEFWGWLSNNNTNSNDHEERLLELWLHLRNPSRVRHPMALANAQDKVEFTLQLRDQVRSQLKIRVTTICDKIKHNAGANSRSRGNEDDEDDGGKKDIPQSMKGTIFPLLHPIVKDLAEAYLKDKPLNATEQSARQMGEQKALVSARVKVGEIRRRQLTTFRGAPSGRFWAASPTIDGKAMIIFSVGPSSSPSPAYIDLCKGDEEPEDFAEARGSWTNLSGELSVELQSGDRRVMEAAARDMGLRLSTAPPPAQVIDPAIIERVRLNMRSAGPVTSGGAGRFWWAPEGLVPEGGALLLSAGASQEFDNMVRGKVHLSGEFRWDREDRKVYLRLARDPGGSGALFTAMEKHLRGRRLFEGSKLVPIPPRGKWPEAGSDQKETQDLLSKVNTFNRASAMRRSSGCFWFSASTALKEPAVVFYDAPPLPPRVWELLDEDPRARQLCGEGTWEKKAADRKVLFSFDGSAGKPGLKRPLQDLLTRLGYFSGLKVEVLR
jgi:hypothetical protein